MNFNSTVFIREVKTTKACLTACRMTEPFALPLVSMVIQTGVSSLHFPSYSIRLSNFVLTLPV